MNGPRGRLTTSRMVLMSPEPEHAEGVADYYLRNIEHLGPWSPKSTGETFTVEGQRERLMIGSTAFQAGTAWKWHLFAHDDFETVRGVVHFSQIVRGACQGCTLGYSLDREWQGRGLMKEGLRSTIEEVFSARGRLHRIQANALPENERSLRLLAELGFEPLGIAPGLLHIDGRWQDLVMTALLNLDYRDEWL